MPNEIYFSVNEKPLMDYILAYNIIIVALNVKVLRYSEQKSENGRFRRPHSHLMLTVQRTPANVHINISCDKLGSLDYIFAADNLGLVFMNFFVVGSEKHAYNVTRVHNSRSSSVQGQPWLFILVPIESGYATSR